MDKYSFFYKIPDNWCWTKLGKITSIIGGGTPSSKIKEYYDNGNIAWITPSDLSNYNNIYISKGKKMITELGLMKSSAKLLPKGTVCLSSRAPIGYVAIAENELCTNQGFKSFLPSELYEPEYLYWYLKSIKHILEAKASGTTFLELSAKKAGEVEIPLPPINEQQRIVNIIESLFAKLDRAKELIENTLAQFEQNKMAILHKAFTGELTVKWRKENNIDLSSWEKIKLGKVLLPMQTKKPTGQFFRYIDIDAIDNKRQIVKAPKLILTEKAPSRASRGVETGNILFSMVRPYLKNIAQIDSDLSDCIASTGFYVCRCKPELNSRFLYYLFIFDKTIDYLMQFMKGDNSPSIRKDDLLNMKIDLPTIEEQQEIVNILDKLLAKYNKIKNLEQQLEKIELLKKAILAKAFRGELGTNNPDEESAENLLKEILAEK